MCIISEMKKVAKTVEYRGYWYRLSEIVEILILGLLCQLQTMKDIHDWAKSEIAREMLREKFQIRIIPCYSHFTNLVGMIDSDELNKIFMEFFQKLAGELTGKTVAIDGKTICSTANMKGRKSPLHIASAFVVQHGITIGQLAADAKSNEIPAVQELIKLLNIEGATIVADALNCQKKTVDLIIKGGADYVLAVKKNQHNLYDEISKMVDFKRFNKIEERESPLEKCTKIEKGHGRIDKRTAYVTHDVEWLLEREKWTGLQSFGAIVTPKETRYYISSRKLAAEQLLDLTRQEWAVESMHWQLDVIYNEDRTTLHKENAQKTLNILRKTVLNIVRTYRDKYEPKSNITGIMRKCLFNPTFLVELLSRWNVTDILQN